VLQVAASHGFFLNLTALLLKLCGPFLDGSSQVFWNKVDWKYVVLGDRLDFKEVRALNGWGNPKNMVGQLPRAPTTPALVGLQGPPLQTACQYVCYPDLH
jgi:hypothetical protein